MLLDALIQKMISMTEDQLRKIKSFILHKLCIKNYPPKNNFFFLSSVKKSVENGCQT